MIYRPMTSGLRPIAAALSLIFIALWAAPALAASTLTLVRGSGEFQSYQSTIEVEAPEILTLQWTTDQAAAKGATWQVTNVTAGNAVVASGTTAPAPTVGHFLRFDIAANAFLKPSVGVKTTFKITIQPYDSAKVPLGGAAMVVVIEDPTGPPPKPVVFGANAVFPDAVITNYNENIGVVQSTQLQYAVGDVTLHVSNPGKVKTDPMWLSLTDANFLMDQQSAKVAIPPLNPGDIKTVTVHVTAHLPPPTSQMPEDVQYAQWGREYDKHCGVEFHVAFDWRGPVVDTPMSDHKSSLLKLSNGFDQSSLPVCDATQCVNICQVAKNIDANLDGHVVGYSYFIGRDKKFGAGGKAWTKAEGVDRIFAVSTKTTVASVSKLVTAIATVRLLDNKGISLKSAIGPFLPSDWSVSPSVKAITFEQLLAQTSGIKDYGNVKQDYATVKSFFTQSVDLTAKQTCKGSTVNNPPNPINPGDKTRCYSNYNFAILRILLPKVAGFAETPFEVARPSLYASEYIQLVQQNEFNLVGRFNVSCAPPNGPNAYAYAYLYPGTRAGTDFGDNSLVCGAAGWYLTAEDMAAVMLSLNQGDGRILTKSKTKDLFKLMETSGPTGLGFDKKQGPGGYRELEKNGLWTSACDSNQKNCDSVSTSVAVFGPGVVGVLFMNSDVSGGPVSGQGAAGVLENAYYTALYPKPKP